MQDYTGNSHKAKAEQEKPAKSKNIEKVTIGEVIVPKKTVGRKAKDLVIDMDPKGVAKHVFFKLMLPAAKNLMYDAWVETGKQTIFKGATPTGRSVLDPRSLMQRITYNGPVSRGISGGMMPRDPREVTRMAPPVEVGPRRSSLSIMDSLLMSSREEADKVIEMMVNIIDQYEVATVQDLKELIGQTPDDHVDNKWGWIAFNDASVRQIREGFLLEFIPPEPVSNF